VTVASPVLRIPKAARLRTLNQDDAIDLYLGDLARRGRRRTTIASYRRLLFDFAALAPGKDTHELELADYERFLNRWTEAEPSTLASGVSLVKGYSRFLYERGLAIEDVAFPLRRPKRKRPEDLDVVRVPLEDVAKLFHACRTWQELLCIATAVYLGARRAALARVRRRDVDLVHGTVRFLEKGGKVVTKPLPREYHDLLLEAERHGLWADADAYLIPNRRQGAVRRSERCDKVIWNTVKLVAERAGVRSHVHALRAAFADAFDEQHPDQPIALKELMGHQRLETTLIYLSRKRKTQKMELVRDLSWGGFGFESQSEEPPRLQGEAHTGFEPVFQPNALLEPSGRESEPLGYDGIFALLLERLERPDRRQRQPVLRRR
jgi:integrase